MAGNNEYYEQRMKEITERLEKGVEEMFTSERYTQYLKTMSQFHTYSFNNTLLIAMQRPDATLVAGYGAWQKKFNRQVKRGEKGIQIISPYPVKHRELREKVDDNTGETILKPDSEPEMEEVVHTVPRFRVATVFDVSQTEGEPLPELVTDELTGSVEDYNIFMAALESVSPVPIRFAEIEGGAKGFYSTANKETVIQNGMSEIQTVKTAIHETAHAKLHDRDVMKEQGVTIDKMEREIQAESIAYTVCQHFGIDTSDYSFPYVASWSSGKDMKELRTSMDTIRHTATEFIDALTEQIQIIRDERAQEIETAEYQEVEQQEKTKTRVTEFTEEIELEGHIGTWHTVDSIELMGQTIYLMESNEHGEKAANVAVDADGIVVAQDLWNGFDAGFHEVAVEYFSEKGITYEAPDITDDPEVDKEAMPEQSKAGEPMQRRKLYSAVYHNNAQYAREHGELDRYRQSRRENIACKNAIEQAIRDYFDGLHLNPDAVYTVLDQFGNERVSFVLATTVQTKDFDTRFSGTNRDWAKQNSLVGETDSIFGDGSTEWVVESHPAVLDGYITQTRNEILNRALEAVETRFVSRDSKNLEVKGYPGTWHTYDWKDYNFTRFLLMRNDNPELGQADLILSENGELVAHDVKHGFDQEARLAVSEYLKKYGESLYGMDTLPEKATVTLTDGMVLYTSSTQKLLKNEWEESLVGKDQSGNERHFNFHEIARVLEPGGIYLDMPEIHVIQKIFVTADLRSEPMQKTEYPSMEEALGAYFNLPDDKMKSLGIEVTTPDTKNFLLLQCFDGKDTVTYGRETKDSFLNPEIYKAVKDVEQGLAAHLESMEKEATEKPLTADEIMDFRCVNREYYGASRTQEYVFECKVRGEPDVLTYELSYHDDGEGFSLHTENNDIWDRMSYRELEKLEAVVNKEVTFDYWMNEVEKTSSSRGVKEVEYAMADTENLNLTGEQRSRIYQRMEEKQATFIAFYYIDNDRHGSRPGNMYQEFPDIESALEGYAKIPNHFDKEIGMESTEKHPSRMSLIECKNGIDRLYDIEGASLSGKWVTEEVMDAHAKAGDFLINQDMKIAYHLKPTDQYLTISTVDEGYAYAFYDKSYHQINGSEYWNTEMDIEDARNTILASAGTLYMNCEVIDYANLMAEVEKAAQQTVEPKISFYVAECAEFPILGEYHEGLTLEEAVETYKQIPSERMNGVKTIGFQLVDDSIYSGMDMDILTGFEVDRESVNHVDHYRDSPLVQKALDDLEVALQPVHDAERSIKQPVEDKAVENTEKAFAQSARTDAPGGTRKSVLQALRERTAKQKEREKQDKQPTKKARRTRKENSRYE